MASSKVTIPTTYQTKYLTFEYLGNSPSGKTECWVVWSRNHNVILGKIRWYGPWRTYTFFPEAHTIFNAGCMIDIIDHIDTMLDRRKK